MLKISDFARSVLHDAYVLYVKGDDNIYREFASDSDFSRIALIIDEIVCSDYFIERFTCSQYIPKERESFIKNGK